MKKSRRHALGQHFLASRAVLHKIVEAIAPRPEDVIVEIGAGKGVLTAALAERAGRVIAVEKDERLIPGLMASVPGNVEVVHADVLGLDFRRFSGAAAHAGLRIAGNLPYSISSPLLFKILDDHELLADCFFLLQREFAERVTAVPGTKKFAPLSILVQNYFRARIEFKVAPGSFSPPPEVDSAFLSLRRREAPLLDIPDEPLFREFLRAAFAQRRKQLWKNLEGLVPVDGLHAAFSKSGLGRTVRAEELPAAGLVGLFGLLLPHLLFYAKQRSN